MGDTDKQDKMQALVLLSLVTIATCYLEYAPYDVVKEYEGWEVRSYPPTRWVSTLATDVMPHDGEEHRKAFYRLFHGIDGSNDADSKIPMTAPVSMRIVPGEGPNCESNFTMSFYIPSDLQGAPPQPTGEGVFIEEREEMKVVARRFGGFPTDITYSSEAATLYGLAMEQGMMVKDIPL